MHVKRFSDAKPYEAPNHRGVVGLRLQGFEPGGPTNQEQAYTAVLLAVRQGRLTPQRVATAVAHVLALKRAYGLLGR